METTPPDARILQPRTLKLLAVLLILAASIPSFMTIPFMGPWPLDFQNLWTFHDCFARDEPYAASGAACGDAQHREMRYPPLLYWSFAWTRLLTFAAAGQLFMAVVAVATAAAVAGWLRWRAPAAPDGTAEGLFAGLLLVQYPVLFAVERGNNDALPLLAWTIAAWLLSTRRPGAAGAVAGLAAVYKLYPAFACLVAGAGYASVALRRPERRRDFAAFAAGGVAAVAVGLAVVWRDSVTYFTVTMPRIAQLAPGPAPFAHPLRDLWPLWGGWALAAPLLLAWCAAAALVFERDRELALAGALAISTYFAGTSWDYNLVTTFPLLIVLFRRMRRPEAGILPFALLLAGLVGIVGHRGLFDGSLGAIRLHIAIQWGFLMATAAAAPWLGGEAEAERAPADGAAPA